VTTTTAKPQTTDPQTERIRREQPEALHALQQRAFRVAPSIVIPMIETELRAEKSAPSDATA